MMELLVLSNWFQMADVAQAIQAYKHSKLTDSWKQSRISLDHGMFKPWGSDGLQE